MITFDTMAIIWGVQKKARAGQEHMIEWTSALLQDQKSTGVRFAITAPVLGEYLAKFDDAELPEQLAAIQKNFVVVPYDARAAGIAAQLWQRHGGDRTVERPILKADIQIVATAQAAGIGTLYTNDSHLRRIAQGILVVKDIREPDAGTLFKDGQ
jgi:predicted nucleic acid-binding protein